MNKKIFQMGILFLTIIFLSGCGEKTAEQKTEADSNNGKTVEADCSAGFSKTVAGMKYQRIGSESQAVNGKTMNLCCWNKMNNQGQKEKKICGDRNESPIGYANGILWEIEKGTDNMKKAMETYQKDGKNCQQHYEKNGSLRPESCK